MNSQKTNKVEELLSLGFVLSFLLLHNIYIVLVGIILSLYATNKKNIHKILIKYSVYKKNKDILNLNNKNKLKYNNKNYSYNDFDFKLVEEIEELGYVPSLEKDKNSTAA